MSTADRFVPKSRRRGFNVRNRPIGGETIEVEIGETLIVHRKYGRDRILSRVWLFGGTERTSKRRFVEPLGDKNWDKTTLVPLIQKHINPGSVTYSDSWDAYKDLSSFGLSPLSDKPF